MTADEVATSLGIDPKTLRAWLHRTGARSPAERGQRWVLDRRQIDAAKEHFAGRPTGRPATRTFKVPRLTGTGGKDSDEG